jgi:hypothetical protein
MISLNSGIALVILVTGLTPTCGAQTMSDVCITQKCRDAVSNGPTQDCSAWKWNLPCTLTILAAICF